jgi:hypothetical protein
MLRQIIYLRDGKEPNSYIFILLFTLSFRIPGFIFESKEIFF